MSNDTVDLLRRTLLDQSERWRRGRPISVEEYLGRHPALAADEEHVLDLISNEIFLRSSRGDAPNLDEYLRRFPHLAEPIALQFQLHQTIGAASRSTPEIKQETPPVVPGYEIIEELGRGSMGVVYKARDAKLRRLVALKVLRTGAKNDADRQARFQAEAEAVARLQHPTAHKGDAANSAIGK